jgi:hypothetical protein
MGLQVFTLNLMLYTIFGQFIVFITPSIQTAQLASSGGFGVHVHGLHVQTAWHVHSKDVARSCTCQLCWRC